MYSCVIDFHAAKLPSTSISLIGKYSFIDDVQDIEWPRKVYEQGLGQL